VDVLYIVFYESHFGEINGIVDVPIDRHRLGQPRTLRTGA
jgi:hypothetical protein